MLMLCPSTDIELKQVVFMSSKRIDAGLNQLLLMPRTSTDDSRPYMLIMDSNARMVLWTSTAAYALKKY